MTPRPTTTPTTASASNDPRLIAAVEWLKCELNNHKFSDIQITISLHNGQISKLCKSVSDKFV